MIEHTVDLLIYFELMKIWIYLKAVKLQINEKIKIKSINFQKFHFPYFEMHSYTYMHPFSWINCRPSRQSCITTLQY